MGLTKLAVVALLLAFFAFRCLGGQAQATVLNGAGWMLVIVIGAAMWRASGRSRSRR
jgi:hypothetical protein